MNPALWCGPGRRWHHAGRERREERLEIKGEKQPDGEDADLLAVRPEPVDGLGDRLDRATHRDDHALGLRVPVILEQMIRPARDGGKPVHDRLHHAGQVLIEPVHRLTTLKINIGILRRAAQGRPVRRHGPGPKRRDVRLVDDGAQVVVRERGNLGHLVRGAEPVEEMDERHPGAVAGGMGDQREVVRFLSAVAAQQSAPRGPAGHHILVVAEDGKSLRRQGAGADMHRERQQFAGDLVEVGDHQQEPLRSREGRRQRPAEQTAVHGAGHPALGLHLHDARHLAPEIGPAGGRPLVELLGHRRGGRDRVDRDQFIEAIGDGGHGLVGIARDEAGWLGRGRHRAWSPARHGPVSPHLRRALPGRLRRSCL